MKRIVLFVTLIILVEGFLLPRDITGPIRKSPTQISNKNIDVPKEQEILKIKAAKVNEKLVLYMEELFSKMSKTLPIYHEKVPVWSLC